MGSGGAIGRLEVSTLIRSINIPRRHDADLTWAFPQISSRKCVECVRRQASHRAGANERGCHSFLGGP